MTQCYRCGERNEGDARYCGTCGQQMPTAGGIESLLVDGFGPESDTAPVPGPGSGELRSTEYVGAPSFGEAGSVTSPADAAPVVAAPTSVVPPPAGPPPQHGQLPSSTPEAGAPYGRDSSASTGLMIAALAVAAVVIVGGVFILLAGGPGDTDVARTVDVSTAPGETVTQTLPAEPSVTAAPPLSTATETTSAATAPSLPVSTPAPAPTVLPAPDSTALPLPSRGPGDLGLAQPILDELCDGRYVTFVGSAIGDRPYGAVVDELLELYPGTNYIWTKTCPSLRQEFTTGADIYGVVFGPYATQQEACDARSSGPNDAYVRRISTFDPQDHTIRC